MEFVRLLRSYIHTAAPYLLFSLCRRKIWSPVRSSLPERSGIKNEHGDPRKFQRKVRDGFLLCAIHKLSYGSCALVKWWLSLAVREDFFATKSHDCILRSLNTGSRVKMEFVRLLRSYIHTDAPYLLFSLCRRKIWSPVRGSRPERSG